MSEENKRPESKMDPLETQQIKKTSAVPLRKETVRVTLKSTNATPPKAATPPSPPKPVTPAPTVPVSADKTVSADKPGVPKATSPVPLKQETMRVTLKADGAPAALAPAAAKSEAPKPPAPTSKPIAPAAAKPVAPPAPTIPLKKPVAPAAPTIPLKKPAAAKPLATVQAPAAKQSQELPKATVQLQQTQQLNSELGKPNKVATINTVDLEDEGSEGKDLSMVLNIIALVLSAAVFYFAYKHASLWTQDGFMEVFK